MNEVRQFLDALGLGQYAEAFEDNAIDLAVIRHIDHEVLKDIGVKAAGHRIRILQGVESLDALRPRKDVAQEQTPVQGEPERRQLTVMFCARAAH